MLVKYSYAYKDVAYLNVIHNRINAKNIVYHTS